MALGLLVVSRKVTRKGRAIRLYRTPANRFYVPAAAVDVGMLLRRSEDYWQQRLVDGLLASWGRLTDAELGVQVFPNDLGGVRIAPVLAPGVPVGTSVEGALLNVWLPLHLEPEDARALQQDLAALVESYSAKHVTDRKANTLVRLAVAPLIDL